MTISLLISNGSDMIEQQALENQARDLAQRLSIIHGLNAPEFFDKSLFRGFIEQLRKHKVIEITQTSKLVFGNEVKQVAEEAFKVLSSEIPTQHSPNKPTARPLWKKKALLSDTEEHSNPGALYLIYTIFHISCNPDISKPRKYYESGYLL